MWWWCHLFSGVRAHASKRTCMLNSTAWDQLRWRQHTNAGNTPTQALALRPNNNTNTTTMWGRRRARQHIPPVLQIVYRTGRRQQLRRPSRGGWAYAAHGQPATGQCAALTPAAGACCTALCVRHWAPRMHKCGRQGRTTAKEHVRSQTEKNGHGGIEPNVEK